MKEIEVRHCDVLVVGGGIAGIAIAERLAREAKRQGKAIRILLVDEHEELGSVASGGLEGWYHTGTLYFHLPDSRTTAACVNGLSDLRRWYARDPLFTACENCNVLPAAADDLGTSYDFSGPPKRWFIAPVVYFDEGGGADRPADRPLRSRDAVMCTQQILVDLVNAATERGVQILTGCTLRTESIRRATDGALDAKAGVLVQGRRLIHVIAKQYVFALGRGLCERDFPQTAFETPVQIVKRASVMVVIEPAVCQRSFVRIDRHGDGGFNHIFHPWNPAHSAAGYSIVADSNALPLDTTDADCARTAMGLIGKTQALFRDGLADRRWIWYRCAKTEFPTNPGTQRGYSSWYGPRWLSATSGGQPRQSRPPNFVCVVPGKFSLFPSLAHQVYLELETRGTFKALPTGSAPKAHGAPVAVPRAEMLARSLQGTERRRIAV